MRIPRASMNDRTYGTLELGDFLTLAARHVQTIPGRQRMLQLRPSVSRSDIQRELDLANECVDFLSVNGNFGLAGIEDPAPILAHLQIEGTRLEPKQILALEKILSTCRQVQVLIRNAEPVDAYPVEIAERVHPYGANYYALTPAAGGTLAIALDGEPTTALLPTAPPSGRRLWWSGRGDNSHTSLERTVDLTPLAPGAPATLTYRLWHDLEEGWDYAYLRASTDGGATWQVLRGAHATDHNPHGNAFGWGYTGRSGGGATPAWVEEVVDLGPYAGTEIVLRVDVVTDDAVNVAGLALDDLAIPAIGWRDDVEGGEAGWRADGFLRHDNVLAQEYLVQLVTWGEEAGIRRLAVGEDGRGAWRVPGWGGAVERALLVVSALTPGTEAPAPYTLRLEEFPQAPE